MSTLLARFGLATLNVAVFFIEEGWIIAMVALLPFWIAIIAVIALLSFFSASSTYLCAVSNLSPFFKNWLEKQRKNKEESLAVRWAVKVAAGAVLISSLIVAIVVSPTTSSLMLHQAGVERKRAYVVDVVNSAISGTIWCGIYGLGINLVKLGYEFVKHLLSGGG